MNDQTNSATKYGIGASPRFATWNSTASSSVFAPDSWSFSRISLSSNAPINWSLARLSCGTSAALGYVFYPTSVKNSTDQIASRLFLNAMLETHPCEV